MANRNDDGHLRFVRSTRCNTGTCVEFARDSSSGQVHLRHSQQPSKVLTFSSDEWEAFASGVNGGEFDPS
ncbi:DUF397 domain-containing protein [Pseudonocardia oceani]|uniref:DUF397 domain-containing protein n=1 Tax=Pseudonocardia oceani TaxID=2792013 RepID=UPI001CF6AB50|nr:DUF397 domain-containing protein [Pseudonocardia oceani]